jgi:D-3-phosphoglycerate dehydrogenase / 2-oxoglutarate reductase
MFTICIPDDAPPVLRSSAVWPELAAHSIDYHDTLPGSEERLIERIGSAEAVLNIRSSCKFTERVFAACAELRMVSIWGTGTDHVDLEAAARHGVTVCNTPGVSAVSIAEQALGLLLAVARHIPQLDAATRAGGWPRGYSTEMRGKTCGIIGLGAVGREFARLAGGIGMKVVAWTMHARQMDGIEMVGLDELYGASDVVSLHLRLSPETTGFIGEAQFRLMKPSAILINTARGAIVDEAAMMDALTNGRIAGAGLDVFAVEPLPAGHPLTRMANVVISPHCAGITPEAMNAGLRLAVENIRAAYEGRPQNVVSA